MRDPEHALFSPQVLSKHTLRTRNAKSISIYVYRTFIKTNNLRIYLRIYLTIKRVTKYRYIRKSRGGYIWAGRVSLDVC